MKILIEIPDYTVEKGFRTEWEYGFEIKSEIQDNEIIISANKAGLLSLAKHLLSLAEDEIPAGYHLHYDEYNSLETDSVEIILQKI